MGGPSNASPSLEREDVDAEKRPPVGAIFIHRLTRIPLIVLEHEGGVNASSWFTVRDPAMLTHRCRIEEIDAEATRTAVQEKQTPGRHDGGQYL